LQQAHRVDMKLRYRPQCPPFTSRLPTGNILDVSGIRQNQFEIAVAQNVPDRLPVNAGRLHGHMGATLLGQPMQGRTATFSTFSDAQFDETAFEAQLMGGRSPFLSCFYWILKLKARFLAADYVAAFAAAQHAEPLLGALAARIRLLDYFYYSALAMAALYENASADEQAVWREGSSALCRSWTAEASHCSKPFPLIEHSNLFHPSDRGRLPRQQARL
jgi:hypothetical protein